MVPRSRGGDSSVFNLFPFNRVAHARWHHLFLNLTLLEVWDLISLIHHSVLCEEVTNQWWIGFCDIKTDSEKKRENFKTQLEASVKNKISTKNLRMAWMRVFHSERLEDALKFLKLMMLISIFGTPLYINKYFLKETDLVRFFKEHPLKDNRERAFFICFPGMDVDDVENIRIRARKIIFDAHRLSK